jgi:hypothetical protein
MENTFRGAIELTQPELDIVAGGFRYHPSSTPPGLNFSNRAASASEKEIIEGDGDGNGNGKNGNGIGNDIGNTYRA